ncbi:MAG: MarR family transcriptional regulator [Euryarchaeota archaeon]|nr:MarR family transcriptional regulator [Euryarchaeota archaeon]
MDDKRLGEITDNLFLFYYPFFLKKLFKNKNFKKRTKLPFSHYQTLGLLKKCGELSMSEIGKLLCIKKQNMTYLADKLVEKGMIRRAPDLNDRRVIKIVITDKGNECFSEWRKNEIKEVKENVCSLDDEDLEKLYESVENIKYILSKVDED